MMPLLELGIKLDIIVLVIFETCWIFVDFVTTFFIVPKPTETLMCMLISLQKTFT